MLFKWPVLKELTGRETNLESMGLASADRSNKATLLLTAPCSIFKSSAKDLSPPKSDINIRQLSKVTLPFLENLAYYDSGIFQRKDSIRNRLTWRR